MGRRIVPLVILSAIMAFAVAALSTAFVIEDSRLWRAAVTLVVLGGVTPLIYAVNSRIVPVFSGRQWPHPRLMYTTMLLAVAGGWVSYIGRARLDDTLIIAGAAVALAAGLLFIFNIMTLFRSPKTGATPPLPFPEQSAIDRIGTSFMRLASIYLLFGLIVGLMLPIWTPERGRWDLVWAHLMLVGWFVSMASGVLYHVLPRWTGERWRRPRLIRIHLLTVLVGLPLMVLALALDLDRLFMIAGPLQAAAVLLFIWNIVPPARKLPAFSGFAVVAAAVFLGLGVSLGASVAMDPANHVNMRFSHAEINLFGWGSLLICGVGYYLFPRFAGQPLRWTRLITVQLAAQVIGVTVSAFSWWWYLAVDTAAEPFITAGAWLMTASLLTFGFIIARTMLGSSGTVSNIAVQAPSMTLGRR